MTATRVTGVMALPGLALDRMAGGGSERTSVLRAKALAAVAGCTGGIVAVFRSSTTW